MLNNDKSVDKLFQDGLGEAKMAPPAMVWDGISAALDQKQANHRLVVFWRWGAAAAVLFGVAVATWLLMSKHPYEQQLQMAESVTQKSNPLSEIADESVTQHVSSAGGAIVNNGDANGDHVVASESVVPVGGTAIAQNHDREAMAKPYVKRLIALSDVELVDEKPMELTLKSKHTKKVYQPLYVYEPEKEDRSNRIVLGGAVSPSYSYRQSGQGAVSTSSNLQESGISSIGGGINLRIESTSRWSFETGVLYAQLGQEVNHSAGTNNGLLFADASISAAPQSKASYSNSMGAISFSSGNGLEQSSTAFDRMNNASTESMVFATDEMKQTLDYLEVPFLARYAIFKGYPTLSLAGGISTNFLMDNQALLYRDGQLIDVGSTADIRPVSLSSSLGLGLELPISHTFRFNIEPRFKYFLGSVSSNQQVDFRPYSFAVFGGVTMVIK